MSKRELSQFWGIIKSSFLDQLICFEKKKISLIKGQREVTSFTASRLEVGLKRIFVICSEMTCALFAHIAPPAFL